MIRARLYRLDKTTSNSIALILAQGLRIFILLTLCIFVLFTFHLVLYFFKYIIHKVTSRTLNHAYISLHLTSCQHPTLFV